MGSNHRPDFSGHDLGAGAGHIVPIPEIHEEEGDHAGSGEESSSSSTPPPPPGTQPHLTIYIPSANAEDSTSYHSRTRTPQTPVSGSSRSNRNATTNWRIGSPSVQSSPWRRSPSVKKLLHRFSSKFRGSALDAMMTEGSQLSSPYVKRERMHRLASLPVAKMIASPQLPYSLPVTPVDKVSVRRLSRSFSAPLNRKEASKRRGDSIFRVIHSPLGGEKDGVPSSENEVSGEGEDIAAEEAVCRICWMEMGEGGESMKLQCSCKGDLALAHRECAIQWFSVKGNKNCEVCKEEVQNLPVTLLRLQSAQPSDTAGGRDSEAAASRTWTYLAILLVVSVLAYCCLLELLLARKGTTATVVSLPCGLLLGLLSSFTPAAMASSARTVFLYAAVQFGLVLLSVYIFLSLMVASILLATSAGFGLAMCSRAVAVKLLMWRRRRRALAASQVP